MINYKNLLYSFINYVFKYNLKFQKKNLNKVEGWLWV